MLVVDASFVVSALLTPDGLARLKGHGAVAPPLLWSETTSVLHEMRWRNAISPALAETAFGRLRQVPIALRKPARLYREAWTIATQFGWAKTYDAEYVALARLLDCPLLTIDAKLARTAVREVRLLAPADLGSQ